MKKISVLLLVLLIVFAAVSCVAPHDGEFSSEPVNSSAADSSAAQTSSEAVNESSAVETPSQSDESNSEVSDEQSKAVSEPEKLGSVQYHGTLKTDFPCPCKLVADYTVVTPVGAERDVNITVSVKLVCHQIAASARKNLGKVIIGDKTFTFSTDKLENYDIGEITFEFVTQSRTLTRAEDGTLQVAIGASWPFRGTYGGVEISDMDVGCILVIAADGSVTVK